MKKYIITVIDFKTKKVLETIEEISKTRKYLKTKYSCKFQFSDPKKTFTIKRLFKKPGVQVDLFEMIAEVESQCNPN